MVLASFMEKKTPAGAGRDLSPASEFNSRAKNRSPSQPQVQQSMPHTASHRAAWIWQKPLLKKCLSLYFCHWQKSLNGDLTANLVSTDFPRLRHQGVNTVSDGAAGSSGGGGKKKKVSYWSANSCESGAEGGKSMIYSVQTILHLEL